MPEYLAPGVYIEEVATGPRPIEGVGTAMAAFIGFAAHCQPENINKPVLITNWNQYVRTFGKPILDERGEETGLYEPHADGYYLSHAVEGYFINGGGRCYVTSVAPRTPTEQNGQTPPTFLRIPSRAGKDIPALTFAPRDPVERDITVEVLPPTPTAPANSDNPDAPAAPSEPIPEGAFTLKIQSGDDVEIYEQVTLSKRGPKSVGEALQKSKLVKLAEAQLSGAIADRLPEFGSYEIKRAETTSLVHVKSEDLIGDVVQRSGVAGMEIAEDVTMVCCPDLMSAYQAKVIAHDDVIAVQQAMIAHCERMADRMAILDTIPDLSPQQARDWRNKVNYDSKFASLYYPWVKVRTNGKTIEVPPCGHIAGIYARNDRERGVHKAPANEDVRGILGPAVEITKGEQEVLNPIGVNCIRTFTGRGVRVWGARTLSSDPAWRYINVRRLFNYVEKSIERGTQWVVFEPNDPNLWARVRRDVGAFLTTVWRDGMLFGTTPAEAFYVKCDAEINPPETRDQGKLIIEVGLAPVKPAEFVVFRFSQFSGGGL